MSINFFDETFRTSTTKELFGLCDDNSTPEAKKQPAYLSEDKTVRDAAWIGEVFNHEQLHVDFYPVDHGVSSDGGCDCMLHYNEADILFVELKERNSHRNAIRKGASQLVKTICQFKQNYGEDGYKITARICNALRPAAVEPSSQKQSEFKDATGCGLSIGRKITIG